MGQVVSIVGEPGLGKSRLVHTIRQIVTERRSEGAGAETEADVSKIVQWSSGVARFAEIAASSGFGLLQKPI
jgi:ABC-type glutathione transport system ATPase component